MLFFVAMHGVCGVVLSLIFQPAHIVEEAGFYAADENQSVENSWAAHQLKTTVNFATGSKIFSWFVGGLNFQVEHHLFPTICHVHYPKISKIVKETAEAYGLPYFSHKTWFGAIKSHFVFLHKLGAGRSNQELAGTV